MTYIIFSFTFSYKLVLSRASFKWLQRCIFKGSLQVTNAKLPAKFCKIRLIPLLILFSSYSELKSLRPISLVVIIAMVTDLEIIGDIISFIAFSKA